MISTLAVLLACGLTAKGVEDEVAETVDYEAIRLEMETNSLESFHDMAKEQACIQLSLTGLYTVF